MIGHIASDPEAPEHNTRSLEAIATEVHLLSYFLISSRGCRLVMISDIEFDIITEEIHNDLGLKNDGPFIMWRSANNFNGGNYFNRREAAEDQRIPETIEEKEWLSEHRRKYKDEIKNALLRAVQKTKDFDSSGAYEYVPGSVVPLTLFDFPW